MSADFIMLCWLCAVVSAAHIVKLPWLYPEELKLRRVWNTSTIHDQRGMRQHKLASDSQNNQFGTDHDSCQLSRLGAHFGGNVVCMRDVEQVGKLSH